MLLGNKADPSCQASSGRECLPIAHLRDQGGGADRANAGDFLEPPAFFTRAVPSIDALIDGADLRRDRYVLAGKNIETELRGVRGVYVVSRFCNFGLGGADARDLYPLDGTGADFLFPFCLAAPALSYRVVVPTAARSGRDRGVYVVYGAGVPEADGAAYSSRTSP